MPPPLASTTVEPSVKQRVIEHLHFVRLASLKRLADWPADRLTFQRTPEDNHALWVMGHLAGADAWACSLLKIHGAELPSTYERLFGMGSTPVPDHAAYPPADEVRGFFTATRSTLRHALDVIDPAALHESLAEASGGFVTDGVDLLLKTAWHEGWHMGQLSLLRRAMK
jgi:hypothetical protein